MVLQRVLNILGLMAVLALIIIAAMITGLVPPPAAFLGTPDNYERTTVTITNNDSDTLGVINVRIADIYLKQYIGLSNTASLENGSGMLFTYDSASQHTFVMREMDFPLDIIFIGANGRINTIESAPAPDPGQNGESIQRTGRAQYILEVPRGWTTRNGINSGDQVQIE
ncbi:DUF192 domain-containing protein [Halococcus sp. IIIV-5B]|uniref:DUF192 domain-containing protein n=1 Tax=Halococcus sp. IIIV-5B TaxID=2321230 RepID=UPI000E74A398|nr:DUF192 domain-containing protein [Halococcus sp. IIIV-5B]RJT07096.1 DUF192 domain-containing protein [Halococcus sp. IIIV-5B]